MNMALQGLAANAAPTTTGVWIETERTVAM